MAFSAGMPEREFSGVALWIDADAAGASISSYFWTVGVVVVKYISCRLLLMMCADFIQNVVALFSK